MPIYIYKCESCEQRYSAIQPMTDEPLEACSTVVDGERCEGKPRRIVAKSAFTLKGSGWYRDGYQ